MCAGMTMRLKGGWGGASDPRCRRDSLRRLHRLKGMLRFDTIITQLADSPARVHLGFA